MILFVASHGYANRIQRILSGFPKTQKLMYKLGCYKADWLGACCADEQILNTFNLSSH